jgi:hypothetical protein
MELIGKTFGRLTVIGQDEDYVRANGRRERIWVCRCNCKDKTIRRVMESNLKRNNRPTRSCGCIAREQTAIRSKKYNKYDLSGEYGIGYTSNTNSPFYFDLEDYELIKEYCWREETKGYIRTSMNINGKEVVVCLHRLIMNAKPDELVDHIKHKKYDNRKSQLRIVNNSQNTMNSKPNNKNTSGVPGVHQRKNNGKWVARITINDERLYLGTFVNFEDAVAARRKAEDMYFGEFSYRNSIKTIQND